MKNLYRQDIKTLINSKKKLLSELKSKELHLMGSKECDYLGLSIIRHEIFLVNDFISDLEFILTL